MSTSDRHPATVGLLRWFEYSHLPEHLQAVSRPIGELAHAMVDELPDGPELTTGLRKLLEAKDCLVRAALEGVQTRSAAPTLAGIPLVVDERVPEGEVRVEVGVTTACPFRTYRVGADEPGRWLECGHLYSPHRPFPHRTADGEAFE